MGTRERLIMGGWFVSGVGEQGCEGRGVKNGDEGGFNYGNAKG